MEPPRQGALPPEEQGRSGVDSAPGSTGPVLPNLPKNRLALIQEQPDFRVGGKRIIGGQPIQNDNVIHLEKHFLAKQIRNYRRPRREPGALVLLRIFRPGEPA